MYIGLRLTDAEMQRHLSSTANRSAEIRSLMAEALAARRQGHPPPPHDDLKTALRQLVGVATNINQVVARVNLRGENAELKGALAASNEGLSEIASLIADIRVVVDYWRDGVK